MSETTYKLNCLKRDNWRRAQDTLARAVVNEAIDVEHMRQAEFMRKLEEVAKAQAVQRIRVRL